MSTSREDQTAWVKALLGHTGLNAHQLATKAGINSSTLHRFLSSPDYDGMLSGRTLSALADVSGVQPMEFPGRQRGMGEADAVPFQYEERNDAANNFNRAVRELCGGRNGRDPWVMNSYALELAGILPGDIMIIDLNRNAKPLDIVCAQIYDWPRSRAETVFRVFDPPFLLPRSLRQANEKPVMVDSTNVIIKGVVDNVLRARN
ncbi:MAG: hypothetical protein ACRCU5_13980 [Rhizobiaceae bacterium]